MPVSFRLFRSGFRDILIHSSPAGPMSKPTPPAMPRTTGMLANAYGASHPST